MIEASFLKSHRLRKSSQFQSLSKNSNSFHGKVLYIVWKANGLSHPRLGITVTKKYGDAHVRNRFKRLVREGFRTLIPKDIGYDILVRPKMNGKSTVLPCFSEVVADIMAFVKQQATLQKKTKGTKRTNKNVSC